MNHEIRRKTPDELLREIQEDASPEKGHLKIFLGYASGVGKSFRMFDEARRRHERGQDVVIGALQPKVHSDVQTIFDGLEMAPIRKCSDGDAMDIDAILRRHPAVCVIDGLAFNNPIGLRNRTRWQDAQELAGAGIKVIGSINIQYVEELREQVEAVTGKHVTETVPISFIKSADEIEIVDAPPEEPAELSPEEQMNADKRQERYSLLREITLVLAADVIDHQLNDYLEKHGITQNFGAQERILVCITPRANADEMIHTARIVAEKFHGELIVAYVRQPDLSTADNTSLETKLAYARSVGAQVEILDGKNPVDAILDFTTARGITQLFIGHTQTLRRRPWSDPVEKLIRRSQGMDVRIFPQ
jgi:two-component system, OmpR family, sensor histidine kinase KdpD